jgi:hypothetical protein
VSRARFRVSSEKAEFNKAKTATVTISRLGGFFSVRPYRQRKTYSLPLSEVALMVLWRILKAEAEAKMLAKGTLRKKRVKRGKL